MRYGYELDKPIEADARLERPIRLLIGSVCAAGADAVIVPSLDHLGGDVPVSLVNACDVIALDTENTYSGWASTPFERYGA
ncbi:hypothetical protein [Nocardia sp. XZ_19_385]|uniref:hypothetical protein n=1 Tax=Nocardia sp. XZ_19_385 TaxID=2769488 RepID=UPI00188F0A8C|nr:hypothetical protein [Nocardia sp. XZ_19_385]